jgi:hypothetical protein
MMALKRKCSDAGSASKPMGSRYVLPISEKVKILDMKQKNKILCGDCQVAWQERIFHSQSDDEQRKNSRYTGGLPYPWIQYPRFTAEQNKSGKIINKRFISFKTRAKRELAVTR